MNPPLVSTAIRMTPDMFTGNNVVALRATFQRFAPKGIILSDISMQVEPETHRKVMIVGYVRESEGAMTKQFDPNIPQSMREHEFKRYEFRVKMEPGSNYLDANMLLNKLMLIGRK